MNLLVSMSHTDYMFTQTRRSRLMPQRTCRNPQTNFKAVDVGAISIAIAPQLTITSAISKIAIASN